MKKVEICLSPELIHLFDIKDKIVVIVDIFRATSTMMAALANDVTSITPVLDLESCRLMAKEGYVISGERDGKIAEGFTLGNSPLAYLEKKQAGKEIAMTTTNGTVAIEKTKQAAKNIILGAFVNLQATVEFLISQDNDILILCAGWKGKFNLEDSLFAGAMVSNLYPHFGTECDTSIAMRSLYEANEHRLQIFMGQASHAKRLQNHNIEGDIEFCLSQNIYDIIGILEDGKLVSKKPEK